MKKILIIASLLIMCILTNANADRTHHGRDNGWSTTGKILTGVIITDVLLNHHTIYCQPPTYYHPQPIWINGYYTTVEQRVWIQDPPISVAEYIDGRIIYRMVSNGHWQIIYQQVWVNGYWQH